MKRYVEQLLEDIEVVQNKSIETVEGYSDHNEPVEIDDWIDPHEGGIRMCDLFGLQQYILPSESYLDDEEIRELTTAIIQLWRCHSLYPVFTKKLPRRIKYSLLRDHWNQQVYPVPDGKVDVELCDYQTCPYCLNCPVCIHSKTLSCRA